MAAAIPSRILLFGATGTIGQYITKSILGARPAFPHVAIFTSQNTVDTKTDLLGAWKAAGVAVTAGDVTSTGDIKAALEKERPDTVISCLGRGALHTQTELVRLADESGSVRWFFPSEYGTDVEYGPKSAAEKPHQNKLAIRKYLRENVKNMQVTYLVTGPYFDMWVNAVPGIEACGGFVVDKKQAYMIDDGQGKVGFCTMWDVGKCLVAALRHPEASFGKALKVQSFVVTPKQVLAEYEKQTGAKWAVSYLPLEKLRETEDRLWAEGSRAATSITLRRIWAEGGTLYDKNDNDLIGLAPEDMESLETAVRRAVQAGDD